MPAAHKRLLDYLLARVCAGELAELRELSRERRLQGPAALPGPRTESVSKNIKAPGPLPVKGHADTVASPISGRVLARGVSLASECKAFFTVSIVAFIFLQLVS